VAASSGEAAMIAANTAAKLEAAQEEAARVEAAKVQALPGPH